MKSFVRSIVLWCACTFISLLFPINKRSVFFRAHNGLLYACNPKAISEKLHEMDPSVRIIWSFKNPEKVRDCPDYVKRVKKNTLREYLALFTSKICVFNCGIVLPKKRKGQVYIDTWHGDRAFKTVAVFSDGKSLLSDAYEKIDVVLSGSDYADMVYNSAMKFKGEILHSGSPRNDVFFRDSSDRLEKVRRTLNIGEFDRVLTFAPTFRGAGDGVAELDFPTLLDKLEAKTGKKWCVLVRQHYKVKVSDNWNRDRRIVNASGYPEMQDILLASDVVISDYSSLVGDYVLLNRPVFLYVPDLEEYKSGRGLYFDIEKSPFWYARSEAELFEKIIDVDAESAKKNCHDILDFYGHVCEKGNASEQVCSWILDRV